MKKATLSLSISLLLAAGTIYAKEANATSTTKDSYLGFSATGSTAFTSNYIWRGVSQTKNAPAMQGSLGLNHESGLYTKVWASNIERGDNTSNAQLDIYAGYTNAFNICACEVIYDIGYVRHQYPGQTETNLDEIFLGLSGSPLKNLNTSFYYYLDIDSKPIGYFDLSADYTLPDWGWNTTLLTHYGYYAHETESSAYSDWKLGIAKKLAGFNFEIAYTQTNAGITTPENEANISFTASRAFGGSATSNPFEGVKVSSTAALVTDYLWRGVSKTSNGMAFQSSIDFAHDSGFYTRIWGSSIQVDDDEDVGNLELRLYGGLSNDFSISKYAFNYDIGVLHYDYPLAALEKNVNEIYFGLTASPVENLKTSIYLYSDLLLSNRFHYLDLTTKHNTLPRWGIKTSVHYGVYFKNSSSTYSDWKLAISKDWSILNIELAYVDSSMNEMDADNRNLSDARVVGTLSATF
jgi:uncharacterized protein (TIGR02001 family)